MVQRGVVAESGVWWLRSDRSGVTSAAVTALCGAMRARDVAVEVAVDSFKLGINKWFQIFGHGNYLAATCLGRRP